MVRLKPSKTKQIDAADVPKRWKEFIALMADGDTRIVVEQDGTPIGAIVPKSDLQSLKLSDIQRQQLLESLERMGEAFEDVPTEELEREVAKALAEVRAENRARAAGSTDA